MQINQQNKSYAQSFSRYSQSQNNELTRTEFYYFVSTEVNQGVRPSEVLVIFDLLASKEKAQDKLNYAVFERELRAFNQSGLQQRAMGNLTLLIDKVGVYLI